MKSLHGAGCKWAGNNLNICCPENIAASRLKALPDYTLWANLFKNPVFTLLIRAFLWRFCLVTRNFFENHCLFRSKIDFNWKVVKLSNIYPNI